MKAKKRKKRFGLFALFLALFGTLFVGICLSNIMAVTIYCARDGFNPFCEKIMDLPFLVYLCISFVISTAWTIFMKVRTK